MKKFLEIMALMAATILLLVFMGLISGCAPVPKDTLIQERHKLCTSNGGVFQHLGDGTYWREECSPGGTPREGQGA